MHEYFIINFFSILFLLNFIIFCNLFYMKISLITLNYIFNGLIQVGLYIFLFFFQSHFLILD